MASGGVPMCGHISIAFVAVCGCQDLEAKTPMLQLVNLHTFMAAARAIGVRFVSVLFSSFSSVSLLSSSYQVQIFKARRCFSLTWLVELAIW